MKQILLSVLNMPINNRNRLAETVDDIEQICNALAKQRGNDVQFGWHLDIMDGQYVPQIAMCPAMIEQFASLVTLPTELHFMTKSLEPYKDAITVFDSAFCGKPLICTHIGVEHSKTAWSRKEAYLAFNPDEQVTVDLLHGCDNVMLMSVKPGKGGQSYIPVSAKIDFIKTYNAKYNKNIKISVDGGVNASTLSDCILADRIIVGSAAMKAYAKGELATLLNELANIFT